MNALPGLQVEGLSVDRGGRPVLRDLSFHLAQGAALMVTGSNGAGKSTLLRALAGFIPRVGGTVEFRRADPVRPSLLAGEGGPSPTSVELPEHTHYLGHANALKLALTAVENLRFAAAWCGTGGVTPIEALGAVGLDHVADFPTGILSAGQRRRVALARLLVARRSLWLLDEPAAALDAAAEAVLARLMRGHLDGGGLIVAAIHAPLDVPAGALRLGA